MSMRFPAKLKDSLLSHVQSSYMHGDNIEHISGVNAQMKFQCVDARMRHESEDRHYLPVFLMKGYITEITGDFPYGTTSLYFDERDKDALMRDITYYPTPDELAHLVTVGKFFSDDFTIPPILKQEYVLPCIVDMSVIAPPDPIGYEGMLTEDFETLSEEQQLNLPIFYASVKGTGVSRQNDATLDYYGIDFEDGFDNFMLTAQSSGYTDPPLMKYITEPAPKRQQVMEQGREYYLTEEENERLRQEAQEHGQRSEQEIQDEAQRGAEAEIVQLTQEDIEVRTAERNINKRLDAKFGGEERTLDALKRNKQALKKLENPDARQEYLENHMDFNPEQNDYVNNDDTEKRDKDDIPPEELEDMQGKDADTVEEQSDINDARTDALAQDAAIAQHEDISDKKDSDVTDNNQMHKKVEMDFNPEQNEDVKRDKEQSEQDESKDVEKKDRTELENMEGSDVSDARSQAVVDEAHTRDISRSTAVDKQLEIPKKIEDKSTDSEYELN